MTIPVMVPVVEDHEHTWALRSIDFTDGVEVREFACDSCESLWFN